MRIISQGLVCKPACQKFVEVERKMEPCGFVKCPARYLCRRLLCPNIGKKRICVDVEVYLAYSGESLINVIQWLFGQ